MYAGVRRKRRQTAAAGRTYLSYGPNLAMRQQTAPRTLDQLSGSILTTALAAVRAVLFRKIAVTGFENKRDQVRSGRGHYVFGSRPVVFTGRSGRTGA